MSVVCFKMQNVSSVLLRLDLAVATSDVVAPRPLVSQVDSGCRLEDDKVRTEKGMEPLQGIKLTW